MRCCLVTMFGAAALVLALSGCAAFAPEVEVQAHELALQLPAPGRASPGRELLFVSPIRAQAPYATNKMVYRERPLQLDYFLRNVWAAEPAKLIEPWLLESLENSGVFASVLSGVGAPPTRYRLDTELIILRHEFETSPSQVRLVMRVQLVDVDNRILVDAARFNLTAPAPTRDAYGGVIATNRLVLEVINGIVAFCAKAMVTG